MSSFELSTTPQSFVDPRNKYLLMNDKEKQSVATLRSLVTQLMETEIKPKVNEEVYQYYNNVVLSDVYLFKVCKVCGYQKLDTFIKNMLHWRMEIKPETFRFDEVKLSAQFGLAYDYGFDKNGHPVLYVTLSKDALDNVTPENVQLKWKLMVHVHERAMKKMPKSQYGFTWVADLKDASLSLDMVKQWKGFLDTLGSYYPEELSKAIVIHAGWGISLLWRFVRSFLNEEQANKYIFLSGSSDEAIRQELLQYIDEDQLPADFYGGKSNYTFNVDKEIEWETNNWKRLNYSQ